MKLMMVLLPAGLLLMPLGAARGQPQATALNWMERKHPALLTQTVF